jgi:serine/threonine protein kinase
MGIRPGSRIGPYEVTALIGEGGMGKVWRAHHTALKRDDALKVLPDAFANDPDRLARFQREAQVLASLNHPNIARVYGLEESDGTRALVMELVEGPTISDLIGEGPIAIAETLAIAKQIADALEAAHEKGIVHRDLKPANVKVCPDGTVKVLDFGLAKAMASTDGVASNVTISPDHHVAGHDPGRDASGHSRIHESGTSEGTSRGQAQRHLGVRVCALRDALGCARIRWRRCVRHIGVRARTGAGLACTASQNTTGDTQVTASLPAKRSQASSVRYR